MPTVYVVGADLALRESVAASARQLSMQFAAFSNVVEFIESGPPARPGCVVTDGLHPGASEDEVQQSIRQQLGLIPQIAIGRDLDVTTTVQSMKQGAFTVLEKPLSTELLTESILSAIRSDAEWMSLTNRFEKLQRTDQRLSERERTVAELLIRGAMNKGIANEMELSVRMVEVYRSQLMQKFNAKTISELSAKYSEFRVLSETVCRIDPAFGARVRVSTMRSNSLLE